MKPALGVSVLAAALALSGCGNDSAFNSDVSAVKGSFKSLLPGSGKTKGPQPAQLSGQAIAAVLQSIPKPISVVTFEDEQAAGVVSLIETNGAYRTYGNSARQAMIFAGGLLTGTRGLGEDLMSSNIAQSKALISARRAGQTTRVNRYLDGDATTVEMRFACAVSVGESKSVALGHVRGTGRVVTEACTSGETDISNTYVVDQAGRILWSRQWIGSGRGYVTVQPIRL